MPRALRWIQTDGGPSIAVPHEARDLWEGSDPPSAGRAATDYDSACEAARFVGLVRHQAFVALAIARGPITWLPQTGGGVIVHWEHGDGVAQVEQQLHAALAPTKGKRIVPSPKWKRTRMRLPVPGGKLMFFDAAYRARGLTAKQRLLVTLTAGLYSIDEASFEPDDSTLMTLYRLSRAAATPKRRQKPR